MYESSRLRMCSNCESWRAYVLPKKKAAPAKKPVSKAAPKAAPKAKSTAAKKKPLVDKDDNASDSDGDDGSGPSAPIIAPTNGKKKTASEQYQKVRVERVV